MDGGLWERYLDFSLVIFRKVTSLYHEIWPESKKHSTYFPASPKWSKQTLK